MKAKFWCDEFVPLLLLKNVIISNPILNGDGEKMDLLKVETDNCTAPPSVSKRYYFRVAVVKTNFPFSSVSSSY